MARMSVRTSYALDPATAARIKRLARAWGVSQSEVIRRSVRQVEESAGESVSTPAEVVARYAESTPIRDMDEVRRLAEQLREQRHADDRHRD